MSKGGVGPPLQSFFNLVFGLGVVLRQQEHVCQIEVRLRVALIYFQGGFKVALGGPKILAGQIRRTEVVVSRIKVRRIAEGLLVMLDRLIRLVLDRKSTRLNSS